MSFLMFSIVFSWSPHWYNIESPNTLPDLSYKLYWITLWSSPLSSSDLFHDSLPNLLLYLIQNLLFGLSHNHCELLDHLPICPIISSTIISAILFLNPPLSYHRLTFSQISFLIISSVNFSLWIIRNRCKMGVGPCSTFTFHLSVSTNDRIWEKVSEK